jgi:lysine 2,3-aminomutase
MEDYKNMQDGNNLIEQPDHSSILYSLVDEKDQNIIDEIIKSYPARVTPHLCKLMKISKAIQKQFLPSKEEQKTQGTPTPFEEGKDASKIYGLERLYRDRVLITPHFDCPAYCRFCYKKSRVMRNKPEMTYEEIDKAVAEVATMEDVRGVLITGGDPLMNCQKLFYLLDKLIQLKNITEIRIGTRSLLTKPEIFTDQFCEKLASYILPDFGDPTKSKYLAINVHFNHPDELDEETIRAAYKLTSRGITLRNQTVLLKGINDDIQTIKSLFTLLIRNNIIPYYFNHCMPVEGADHFRCSVEKGQNIYRHLCTESSTSIPHYVFAIQGGKIHVGPDSKFDYIVKENKKYINIVSLYKASEFKEITKKPLPINHTETKEGYIQGLYWDGQD